jgi:predicted metalloprotease
MRLDDQRASSNIEDRRGRGVGRGVAGGGIGVIVLALVAMFFGVDPSIVLQGGAALAPPTEQRAPAPQGAPQDEAGRFVAKVLGSTEEVWTQIFAQGGQQYRKPTLVLFSGQVSSACGMAQSAVGPFYCPPDQKVYIDLDFYRDLDKRFGAPGDFAQAYVLAHEVGHHVQNLLGIAGKVHELQRRGGERQANALSVRMELQADCFAGVWAARANAKSKMLEPGDVEEGIAAAAAVGDDRIQMASRGHVAPDSFTHGSAKQRVYWFRRGLESGDLAQCDTFNARTL